MQVQVFSFDVQKIIRCDLVQLHYSYNRIYCQAKSPILGAFLCCIFTTNYANISRAVLQVDQTTAFLISLTAEQRQQTQKDIDKVKIQTQSS
jgi:hypothetical protein